MSQFAAGALGERLAAVLNAEIGETFARVETEFSAQSLRGTDAQTAIAGAALRFHGVVVGLGGERQEEFAQEEATAGTGNDELRVFPDPSQARPPSPIAFVHRGGVGEGARGGKDGLGVRTAHAFVVRTQRVEKREKTRFHHLVVVLTAGIAGYGQTTRTAVGTEGIGRVVVERDGHNGAHALDQQARIAAFLLVARQIAHLAVTSLGEPALAAGDMRGIHGLCGRKSAGNKAEALCLGFDVCGRKKIIGHGC